MSQKHNIQLGNFDLASLRVIWSELGPLWGCRYIEMTSGAPVNGKESRSAEFFYGRENCDCKNAQFCATHCESKITNYLASETLCKVVKRSATR